MNLLRGKGPSVPSSALEAIASLLRHAEQSRSPVPPITESRSNLTIADAYEIQLMNAASRVASGERIAGHKVGLTSHAMQSALGVSDPDFGHLFSAMFYSGASPISAERFIAPKIEPEIALVLKKPLRGPGLNVADVASAVDFVLPALEIIDSRIEDWKIGLVDTIADNASSAGVVLGPQPHRLWSHDLAQVSVTLTRNGEEVAAGTGDAVMGHPIHALLWLANQLGDLGTSLEPGAVVLPGSCTVAADVAAGDVFAADFGPLGRVSATFK